MAGGSTVGKRLSRGARCKYGGTFDGNVCKKLLCHIDLLDSLVPLHCKAIITAFKCLNDTISACFSTDLRYNFNEIIDKFRISFLDLGISVTPKIHGIFYHVSEFCSSACTGLGNSVSRHKKQCTINSP